MNPGRLDQRLVFEERTTSKDELGGALTVWTSVATVWARMQELSGRELFAAQAANSEVTHHITIRYQPVFANPLEVATMRISLGSRRFNIHTSSNIGERNEWIVVQASEGLNDG